MASVDRRTFLATALAASAVRTAFAAGNQQPASPSRGWIDLHHHFAPPAWVTEVRGRPLLQPANTRWTVEQSLEDMDRGGVAASVVAITNPGLWFGDPAQTRRLARACNDYGATVVRDHPTRFGLFAALPLPDVDASLAEIAYAYDTLKVDGIGLYTSYGDTWLGAPAFRPVMAELNRRKALVTVHPTAADCCRNLGYAAGIGPGTIEYGTDTTRAIMGIAFNGDATRFPDIRFIWSHAGGSAPFLAGRIDGASGSAREALPDGFLAAFKRFHFDVAGAANRGALASLTQWVSTSQIVFGTDFPPGGSSASVRAALGEIGFLTPPDLQAIGRDNAVRLLPRFA
ncbi:MAG: amidohydrolase family protein [Vicinamibacterales bacterium]